MTEAAKKFEDLWIWQEARKLVADIYRDMKNGHGSKDFGFRDQIQRAGVSIMNNIAEGFERSTDNDFARFLDIAKGSCGEVRNMYYAAEDLGYISPEMADERRICTRRISAGIAGLTKHLRKDV
jgi:four helix bundle protein